MTLILGVWATSMGAYQRLALNLAQQEKKRSQLRKQLDAFEIQEQSRANFQHSRKGISDESARVSSRNRSLHTSTQSTLKDQR